MRKLVRAAAGEVVAWLDLDTEESEANGNLIAAAPELLEALEGLLAVAESHKEPLHHACLMCERIEAARAAIAKAKGEEG